LKLLLKSLDEKVGLETIPVPLRLTGEVLILEDLLDADTIWGLVTGGELAQLCIDRSITIECLKKKGNSGSDRKVALAEKKDLTQQINQLQS
jgi:hypothetical protein